MRQLIILPEARMDALAIRHWSEIEFGSGVAIRYQRVIAQAYFDLREAPDRPGVTRPTELQKGFWLYPIRHSLMRVLPGPRVRTARHLVAFRHDAAKFEIARLLHDSMDIITHLA